MYTRFDNYLGAKPDLPMQKVCPSYTYPRYKFPACSNLVFQTNLPDAALTLILYNHNTGQVEIEKTTGSEGNFTLLVTDVPDFILNPWIGYFTIAFRYEGDLYDTFLNEKGEYTGVEIQAERMLLPPDSFTFTRFRFDLLEDTTEPPDGEEGLGFFALNTTFILA